jgi:hypothetical protein
LDVRLDVACDGRDLDRWRNPDRIVAVGTMIGGSALVDSIRGGVGKASRYRLKSQPPMVYTGPIDLDQLVDFGAECPYTFLAFPTSELQT